MSGSLFINFLSGYFWSIYSYHYDSVLKLGPYRELMKNIGDAFEDADGEREIVFLDVGCGTGNLLINFVEKNKPWRFYGLDQSPAMLARAAQKARGLLRKQLIRGNINQSIPFADSSVEGVAMVNALYASASPSEVIRECHRVLKFDGILTVANPVKGAKITSVIGPREIVLNPGLWPPIFINLFIKILNRGKVFHFMEPEDLENLISQNGFQIISSGLAYGNTDAVIKARKVMLFDTPVGCVKAAVVHLKEDLEKVHRLRFDVYCKELKSLDVNCYPNEEEWDEYDEYSVSIILKLGEETIGTIRMVKDNPRGFVLESDFKLPTQADRSKIVEYSRAILIAPHRKGRKYKILLLAAGQWQTEHGYSVCISAAQSGSVSKILEGEDWEYIGEPKPYHNTVSVPMMRRLIN